MAMLLPLMLTLLGAAGTGLGGLLVVLQPHMNFKRLGALQGLAAGLMLSISLIDLLPEAAEEIGFVAANLCFYAGVLFFAAIVAFIPDPDTMFAAEQQKPQAEQPLLSGCSDKQHTGSEGHAQLASTMAASQTVQRDFTCTAAGQPYGWVTPAAAGSRDAPMQGAVRRRSNHTPAGSLAPAAASLDTSCPGYAPPANMLSHQPQLLLQPDQQAQLSGPNSPASSSEGSTDMKVLLTEVTNSSKEAEKQHKRQLLMSGLITALGIALHNFPEGMAVLLAAHKSNAVGISLACAIALHNIPEGVAVALPVYFATGSRWRGLQTAVLSGLAEPLAVILLGLVLPFMELNKHVVDGMLAGVGGIMAFLALHELLPLALQHAGKPLAVGCLFGGMGLMSLTLYYLNNHLLAGMH